MKERITKNSTKRNAQAKGRNNGKGKEMSNNVDTNQRATRNDSSCHRYGDVNDANYYFLDDTVKSQVTNISFNQYVGVPFNIWNNPAGGSVAAEAPSIMTFLLNPAAGVGNNTGSMTGLNLASLNTYTKLSANNAKTTQYGPQDITMLYLAMGQLIAMTSHIARAFGAAKLYNVRNRAYPRRVVTALGFDYDDLIANYADYKTQYNSLMTVLSSIPIPNNVPYFAKCAEIYSYIYLDMEGSSMAQTYAFIPYSTWTIDESSSDTGTKLVTTYVHSYGEESRTMGSVLTILQDMIQAMLNSSTLNYIYSDILRLADKEGLQLYKFATIPDDYVVLPVYNPEIRKWINNAMITQAPAQEAVGNHTAANDVLSDVNSNTIKYYPSFKLDYTGTINPILNFDTGFPSVDDIVDGTRLMALIESKSDMNSGAVALPDYYPVYMKIYYAKSVVKFANNIVSVSDAQYTDKVAALSNFDWAPFLYIVDSNKIVSNYIGDVNFFTTVDLDYLTKLFDMGYQALLSMR